MINRDLNNVEKDITFIDNMFSNIKKRVFKKSLHMSIKLPYPPSGNHRNGFNGRSFYRKKKTQDFYNQVSYEVRKFFMSNGVKHFINPSVVISLYPPDRRRRDSDNAEKTIFDALQYAGVYKDDSNIKFHCTCKYPFNENEKGYINVIITDN